MNKSKITEALLVIVTGFTLLYFIYDYNWFIYVAFGVGVTGILIKPLAKLIAIGWYKLGDILGFIVSKIVLSVMFYVLLVPIALLHNLFNKDVLKLKRSKESSWSERNHLYHKKDLENPW